MEEPYDKTAHPEQNRRRIYRNRANLPSRALEVTLDKVDPEIRKVCEAMVDAVRGGNLSKGILFYGQPGRGKTSAGLATLVGILNSAPHDWLGRCWDRQVPERPGYYTPYMEFLREYKNSWEKGDSGAQSLALVNSLFASSKAPGTNCRVLMIDDVGKEKVTDWSQGVLHDLLRSRWDRDAPTIITTNIPPTLWTDSYGEAMGSFIKEAFIWVEVQGPDRR